MIERGRNWQVDTDLLRCPGIVNKPEKDCFASGPWTGTDSGPDPIVAVLRGHVFEGRTAQTPPGIGFRAVAVTVDDSYATVKNFLSSWTGVDQRLFKTTHRLMTEFIHEKGRAHV
mgnify:CR=1 FL=1